MNKPTYAATKRNIFRTFCGDFLHEMHDIMQHRENVGNELTRFFPTILFLGSMSYTSHSLKSWIIKHFLSKKAVALLSIGKMTKNVKKFYLRLLSKTLETETRTQELSQETREEREEKRFLV
jgi:hypothetical protein